MLYVLILSSFVFCTNSVVKGRFYPNYEPENSTLLNRNGRDVGDGSNFVESDSAMTSSRQKRSILTAVVDHIVAAAEKFHMKPALVEGINDVEGFNNKFQSKLSERSKPINAMLSKGAGNKKVPTKKSKATDSKKVSDESKGKFKELPEDALLRKLEGLTEKHDEIIENERRLMKIIAQYDWDEIDVEDLAHLYLEGACDFKSEQILKVIIDKFPLAKKQLMEGIEKIRVMREVADARFIELTKNIATESMDEELKFLYDELKAYNQKNKAWLGHKLGIIHEPPEPTEDPTEPTEDPTAETE